MNAEGAVSVQNLTLAGGTLGGSGTLAVNGLLAWTSGGMSDTGATAIGSGATLTISGPADKFLNQRTLDNAGTAIWMDSGGIIVSNAATIHNEADATFDAQGDASLNFGSGTLSTFVNDGTFLKSAGFGTTTVGITFTNAGSVLAQSGNLSLGGGGSASGAFDAAAGAALSFSNSYNLGHSNITGEGTVVFNGGAFDILGSVTAGAILIQGARITGTGSFIGDVSNSGSISPGEANQTGVLSVTGNYTQTSSGSILIRIAAANQFDLLSVSGNALLSGNLTVRLLNGYTPRVGDGFLIMTWSSVSGQFTSLDLPSLGSGRFLPQYNGTGLNLVVVSPGAATRNRFGREVQSSFPIKPSSQPIVPIAIGNSFTLPDRDEGHCDELHGRIFFHQGDDSGFVAKRAAAKSPKPRK